MSASYNVARYLPEAAEACPHQVAIRVSKVHNGKICWQEHSFQKLNETTDALAFQFKKQGIEEGSKVLLMVRPGLSLIQICFTLFKIGAVPVVIDPGMGLKSFLNCVRHTEPDALVGIPVAHWISRVFPWVFKSISVRIKIGRRFQQNLPKVGQSIFPIPHSDSTTLAAILFTSGSTGKPKGVCYEHGQFQAQVDQVRLSFGIKEGEIDLPLLPIFALFNPALRMSTVVPQMNPAKPAQVDAALLIQTINEGKVTNSFGSPAIWSRVVDYCERTGQQMPSINRVLMAGAPVPPRLFKRLKPFMPNAKLYSPYGATECLPVSLIESETVIHETAELTEAGAGTCVGNPVKSVQVKIIKVDDSPCLKWEDIHKMPLGEKGEILVTGPMVTPSYYRSEAATKKAKVVDPQGQIWHRMGDVGYFDSKGRLWFCGRVVERVVLETKIYYADCCEGVFLKFPSVKRCALIGLKTGNEIEPAIVIEGSALRKEIERELMDAARNNEATLGITKILYKENFPVDVRHNAKIHRLELAKEFSR